METTIMGLYIYIYIYIGFKVQGSGKYTEISPFPRSKLLGKGLRAMQNV